MKIAIESNDGVTIKSPILPTKGYLIYDINESDIINTEYRESTIKDKRHNGEKDAVLEKVRSLLNDCEAVISRGMDRNKLNVLKNEGKDVFITFKTSTKDAARLYMRELLMNKRMAH